MRYLSKCPNCQVVYHLNLMQMNIAQGQVRCVRCQNRFDAYRCFIHDPYHTEDHAQNYLTEIILSHTLTVEERTAEHAFNNNSNYSHYVYDVMQQRIEGSRLNLYTYLNYLDLVSPIHSHNKAAIQPAKSSSTYHKKRQSSHFFISSKLRKISKGKKLKRNNVFYYIIWGVINISLLVLLIFQILYI